MGNCTSTTSVHAVHHPSAPGPLQIYNENGEAGYSDADLHAKYSIRFYNYTDTFYYFAVFQVFPQQFPGSARRQNIAWQVRGLPARGYSPSTSVISWTKSYGISVVNWDYNEGKFTDVQQQNAELGNTYEVISQDLTVPSISVNPNPIGTIAGGQVLFENNTKPPNAKDLNLGFTVAGNIVAVQPKVPSRGATLFYPSSSYYVSLYSNIKPGQPIDQPGVVLGPVEVTFRNRKTSTDVLAYENESGFVKLLSIQ